MSKKLNKIINFNVFKKDKKMKKSKANKTKENAVKPIRFYEFERLCQMNQKNLKKHLRKELEGTYGYENVISFDGYLYAKGTVPVMLIAHMDTVHKELPYKFVYSKDSNIISSPQGIGGDDRCGVYMILEILKELNCSVLFLEDEEIGCVGAEKFAKDYKANKDTKFADLKVNYLIEFDRRNAKDAVYYDLDNEDFEDFITDASGGHFETNWGSCSDISYVAPAMGVAAVNLSCGYYKEHTLEHTVNRKEMETNIEKAKMIIKTEVAKPFEWKEIKSSWANKWYGKWSDNKSYYGYGGYGNYYDDYYDYYTRKEGGKEKEKEDEKKVTFEEEYEIYFIDEDKEEAVDYFYATNMNEALGKFFINHPYIRYYDVYQIFPTEGELYTSAARQYYEGVLEDDGSWFEKIENERSAEI